MTWLDEEAARADAATEKNLSKLKNPDRVLNQWDELHPAETVVELVARLRTAIDFLRKDYAFRDKWANEARVVADELEAKP